MEFDDLHIGMRVRIHDWLENGAFRPDHWQQEGEMDEWCGEEVTISNMSESSSYIHIEEDDEYWQWYPEDFEDAVLLSADNPNVKFVDHRREELYNRLVENTKARAKAKEVHDRLMVKEVHAKLKTKGDDYE